MDYDRVGAQRQYEAKLLRRNKIAFVLDRWTRRWITKLGRREIQAYQDQKLKEMIRYVWYNSPFYHKKFKDAGIYPVDIRGTCDIRKIPITTKEDVRANQKRAPPYGTLLSVPPERVLSAATTTGTTGEPMIVPFTYFDAAVTCGNFPRSGAAALDDNMAGPEEVWRRVGKVNIITQIATNISLFKACPLIFAGLEYPGISFALTGIGNTEKQIELMRDIGTNLFVATPSYALHVGEFMKGIGMDPKKELKVKVVYLAGEPGGSIPNVRNRIIETWGGEVETWDVCSGAEWALGCECFDHLGVHLNEDLSYYEVLDQDTIDPVDPGEAGDVVVTWLSREALPLIRYRVGDMIKLDYEPCTCGRTTTRAVGGILGRSDDMLKVKGMKIFPGLIEDLVKGSPGLTGEFLTIIGKNTGTSLDTIKIKIEHAPNLTKSSIADLRSRFIKEFRATTFVTPEIEMVPKGSLGKFVQKAQRILDLRKKGALEQYRAKLRLQETLL